MNLSGRHNITTGKVYQEVIHRERRGDYLGKTVQLVPHASDLVQAWIKVRGRNVYVLWWGWLFGYIRTSTRTSYSCAAYSPQSSPTNTDMAWVCIHVLPHSPHSLSLPSLTVVLVQEVSRIPVDETGEEPDVCLIEVRVT